MNSECILNLRYVSANYKVYADKKLIHVISYNMINMWFRIFSFPPIEKAHHLELFSHCQVAAALPPHISDVDETAATAGPRGGHDPPLLHGSLGFHGGNQFKPKVVAAV